MAAAGTVIEVAGLSKTYRRLRRPPQRAVNKLDLTVPEGGVFGFLGPNGSGKTTTIRMLLGLIRPDAGSVNLLGRPVPQDLADTIGSVGALVESPLFFPTMSGRRNLELLAGVAGLGKARVEEVLEQVGLADRGRDRVKGYSLGMRQRLGIAAALMKKPRLLILDEPSNGLDPAGIREIRELIKVLGRSGVTVFLSSHLLSEVEQVCDSVAILRRGELVTCGPVREVLATRATGEVRVVTADLEAAAAVLTSAQLSVDSREGHLLVSGADDPARIAEVLGRKKIWLRELTPVSANLESVFLELTADPSAEPVADPAESTDQTTGGDV
jgi:ABC-2 type transport system ATP-binding protein